MVAAPTTALPPIVLVCHGSRDPRYHQAFTSLVQACRDHLAPQPVLAGILELTEVSLADQLIQIAQAAPDSDRVVVIPLFLGGGVHVQQDLPQAIQTVSQTLPHLQLIQTAPLGQHDSLITLLQARLNASLTPDPKPEAAIVIGHGSRSGGFAQILESITAQLQAPIPITTAYWAQSPQLPQQIQQLYTQGHRRLQVLPCFLFPGGILDQIHQIAAQHQDHCGDLQIQVAAALAPDPCLTQAIVDRARQISGQLG